jgi:hypothetical protein
MYFYSAVFSISIILVMWILLIIHILGNLGSLLQGSLLYHPSSSCYHRPAFEAINLADADFAADPQTSTPRYSNVFSSVTESPSGLPTDDGNCYLSHSESIDRGNEIRVRNGTGMNVDWPQNLASAFHDHNKIEVNVSRQSNILPTQNANYSGEIHVLSNMDHTDFQWQQDAIHNRSDTLTTNKLNVSGVFSSLNEYLNAGKIEVKFSDVDIINNQTSWNQARHRVAETEENGNYAISRTDTLSVVGTKGNHEHSSSVLHPSADAETNMQVKTLCGQNVTSDFQENNHNQECGLTNDQWKSTIDVCKTIECSTQSSVADLIPVAYPRSIQEEANISRQFVVGGLASSDETPDLLDTAIDSNKCGSFSTSSFQDPSRAQFLSVVTSGSDLHNISKDEQSKLTLLPDVATSGRNILETSSIVVSASSDLVSSHGFRITGSGERSDFNNTSLDLVSHKIEANENLVTSPSLDSNENISSDEVLISDAFRSSVSSASNVGDSKDMNVGISQGLKNEDLVSTDSVTTQFKNASIPNLIESKSSLSSDILLCEGNSGVKGSEYRDDVPRKCIPVGFSAVETLSDAELHQYLQELEDNDESESDQNDRMESETKPGMGLSSECQDLSVPKSEIDNNEELLVKNYKAERKGDGNSNSLKSSTEIIRAKNETDVEGELSVKIYSISGSKMSDSSISDECSVPLQRVNSANCSLDEQSTDSAIETPSSLVNRHTASTIPIVPGFTSANEPRTVPIQSVISGTVKVDTAPEPVIATNVPPKEYHVLSDSNSQSVLNMPNSTAVTSTTSSVITSVVSIACQQITENSNQDGPGNDGHVTNGSELSGRVDDISEDIEIKLEIETPDLIATEIQSPNSQDYILDAERTENGLLPLNDSSSPQSNLSREQETDYDLAENGPCTPEIILAPNEMNSYEKTPNELVQVSKNGLPESSVVDSISEKRLSRMHSDKMDGSRVIAMGVSEIGCSEVQSCLVRMPRDGTTINVLGEEERPSRPKYLFLPSKITVENEQEDSENSEESPPVSGAVGKFDSESFVLYYIIQRKKFMFLVCYSNY